MGLQPDERYPRPPVSLVPPADGTAWAAPPLGPLSGLWSNDEWSETKPDGKHFKAKAPCARACKKLGPNGASDHSTLRCFVLKDGNEV